MVLLWCYVDTALLFGGVDIHVVLHKLYLVVHKYSKLKETLEVWQGEQHLDMAQNVMT